MRAELRALTRVLHAVRETQREHGERIAALELRVARLERVVEEGLAEMRAEFTRMRAGFAEMRAGMGHIVALLERADPPPS